jgi:type IV pilus assembly protein PilN
MIRINLLPVRTEIKRQFGRQQLVLGLLLIGVELAVLFALYSEQKSRLSETKAQADALQAEVNELNEQARQVDALNERKQRLEDLADLLQRLEANRSGPVSVLDELKTMLNRPVNDLQRVAQERRNWDTHWNPSSVWLSEFQEQNGSVSIRGRALSNDDVAEFAIRLANSRYFTGVRLNRTSAASAGGLGAVFDFEITATVNYSSEEGS